MPRGRGPTARSCAPHAHRTHATATDRRASINCWPATRPSYSASWQRPLSFQLASFVGRSRWSTTARRMAPDTFASSIYQVALCLSAIAVLRLCIVYLGARLGAILLGTPLIIFPLVAIQAWHGPEITADQTVGSIASMTAVSCALGQPQI